jgi:hypothetical protein
VQLGHSNLLEIYLLSIILEPNDHPDIPNPEEAIRCAMAHAYALMEVSGRDSLSVYTTRRQIRRYLKWFNLIANTEEKPLANEEFRNLAKNIFNVFPKEVEDKYK